MIVVLVAAFILSGVAGLIYESVWSRYLGLFVGHSAYAQVIVLVIFLGGMSLGAAAVAQRSSRLARPLLWYAGVEMVAGLIGLVFHDVFVATTDIAYASIFPALGAGASLQVMKWTIAALLILPQSVLLGMTFPMMSAGVLRLARVAPEKTGRLLALLYFANSFGAAAGGVLAGFVFIPMAGLPGTLYVAAMLNLVVALVVIVAVRVHRAFAATPAVVLSDATNLLLPEAVGEPEDQHLRSAQADMAFRRLSRALLWVAAGTALASFVYEIAWIRMLSLVLGAATHSFELMLSAFILGLALGAWWVRTRADTFANPVRALGIVQVLMGTLAVATMPVYVESFRWLAGLLQALSPTDAGYQLFSLAKYGLSLAVMLPATFCAGITLPLITRTLLAAGSGERAIGTVYAVNTLGSIVGVALAALVLMPWLGLKWLLITGALIDIAFGVALLAGVADGRRDPRAFRVVAACLAFVLAAAVGVRFDRLLLASGVYRYATAEISPNWRSMFYADGRTATVSVRLDRASGQRSLSTNGKPDASLPGQWMMPWRSDMLREQLTGDQSAQMLLPIIALAYQPRAQRIAVIGQGSGMSSHLLLGSDSVKAMHTIEIEPMMIAGSRAAFLPANHRVFTDARSRFIIDDAKSVFAAGRERYDLILSEPSNPWVSGVSGLFTDEFYARVRQSLSERGVLGQWLHLYETNDYLVLSVLAAVHRNFPSYVVHMVSSTDLLIIASASRDLAEPDWSVVAQRGLAEDLRRVLPLTPRTLDATWLADRRALAPLLAHMAGVNSDYFPVLDLGGERARYLRTSANGFYGLGQDRFSIVHAMRWRREGLGTDPVAAIDMARVQSLGLGARLRAAMVRGLALDSSAAADTYLPNAVYQARALVALNQAGTQPGDWRAWLSRMADVEEVLHGGSSGVVDTVFYRAIETYLDRAKAPHGARAAVAYMKALAGWDWKGASAQVDTLIFYEKRKEPWVSPGLLRGGGVVARLQLDDVAGARAVFDALTPRVHLSAGDMRTVLLHSWILAADEAQSKRAGRLAPGEVPPSARPAPRD